MRRSSVIVGVLAIALLAVAVLAAGHRHTPGAGRAAPGPRGTPAVAGTRAAFVFLSRQTTNRCALQATQLLSMPSSGRLQGSCCSPMDEASYARQVRRLRGYANLADIPRDPYDIAASLAQRLLRYDRAISLSAAQRDVYRRAMRMTDEKGPCCCRCWRWDAFRGMAKRLIARRHWNAARLARVITAVDGCGGPRA